MIKIDRKLCSLCGHCIKVCHESCLYIEDRTLKIHQLYCSSCTQCVAICPEQAMSWNDIKSESFDRSLYPDSIQLAELFKERRTIRDYTERKIDRDLLNEIAGYATFAPTHDFNLRMIILDDEELIQTIDSMIFAFS